MNYYLKNKEANQATIINICKRINGKMFKYSTGLKVRPKYWDGKKKKVLKGESDYIQKNNYLKRLNTRFDSIVIELKSDGELNHDNIRKKLDDEIGRVRQTTQVDRESFEEVWLKEWLKELSYSCVADSVKKKEYTLNALKKFSSDTGYPLSFESITSLFSKKFKDWALEVKKPNGKNRYNKDNSIHKIISIVKQFMKWANKKGFTENKNYIDIDEISEEYFAPFALNPEDLKALMNIQLDSFILREHNIRPCNYERVLNALEASRDAFVFRSLCGIRHSDYFQLTPSKIVDGRLQLVTQKTSTQLYIPLHKYAIEILEKYNFDLPKQFNQNENSNLKLLGQIADFNDIISVTHKRGGEKIEEEKQKWELLTTHTARKTFITNCLRAGIERHLIMEVVGIKKEQTFMRYVQVANEDVDIAMKKFNSFLAS